ncbi:hypothetical protein [Streptomyces triticiradicis]|uniref:Uncharacterized protein n=1 Tax=Streptomyces triticiradicis TaxID=2651189 RepID=A0A7J5DM18_9ACTN|nr:hypothetical protein [Streptomyces triticiradicis]KAB1989773.1 hypothetical protein F8144_05330 [Streptomyces triticiradicis]
MFSPTEVAIIASIIFLIAIPAAAWWIKKLGQFGIKVSTLYRKVRQNLRTRIQRAVFNLLTHDSADHPGSNAPSE